MVSAFIFSLHLILAVYVFIIYKKASIGEGFLAVAFVGIVFAVSWAIASMLTNLLFSIEWFIRWYWQPLDSWVWRIVRKEINYDTISLLILTGEEVLFYYFFFIKESEKTSKKSGASSNTTTADGTGSDTF
jgi:hypothetical protein